MTYRPPTPVERHRAVAALEALLTGTSPDLTDLPLHVCRGVDEAGCQFTLLSDPPNGSLSRLLLTGLNLPAPELPNPPNSANLPTRTSPTYSPTRTQPATPSPTQLDPTPGWGAIAFRGPPTLLIEVPHPGSDRHTTHLGLALFQALPTAALLVAGAHRNHADVAHLPDSLFHAYAQTLATTELQLHGFAAASAPDTDAVLTPGPGHATPLHEALAKALTQQGFRVKHHEHLAGRTNAQGRAAAKRGRTFLHLELAPRVRLHHRDRVVEAVTNAWHQQGQ